MKRSKGCLGGKYVSLNTPFVLLFLEHLRNHTTLIFKNENKKLIKVKSHRVGFDAT